MRRNYPRLIDRSQCFSIKEKMLGKLSFRESRCKLEKGGVARKVGEVYGQLMKKLLFII